VNQFPYGEILKRSISITDQENKYLFQGKERDWETGLDYVEARYFDPAIGMFRQVDPLWEKMMDINPYHYTHNDPMNRIDITGLRDINIGIIRYRYSKRGTIGYLYVYNDKDSDVLTGMTLELPWRNNKRDISAIPEGKYKAELFFRGDKYKVPVQIRLLNVPGRSGILIHNGNWIKDTKGCILVGFELSFNKNKQLFELKQSTDKLRELIFYIMMKTIEDVFEGEETNINVIVTNLPEDFLKWKTGINPHDEEETQENNSNEENSDEENKTNNLAGYLNPRFHARNR
jgi:RHS repeat-associated protein